jgi:hypothetical protein
MTIEQRIEKLDQAIQLAKKGNPCHVKSGPQGGQFCEMKGGGGGSKGGWSSSAPYTPKGTYGRSGGLEHRFTGPKGTVDVRYNPSLPSAPVWVLHDNAHSFSGPKAGAQKHLQSKFGIKWSPK